MKLIVGLGNPGLKYSKTRHNAGFDTVDIIAKNNGIRIKKKEHIALTGQGMIANEKVMLVKPMTYMNDSGRAVKSIIDYYKIDCSDILVISDDLTLDVGVLRFRTKGSDGGHNGLKSIIKCVGTQDFARLRIGVGKVPPDWTVIEHVLSRFERKDRQDVRKSYAVASDAVEFMLSEGIDKAMSKYNGSVL